MIIESLILAALALAQLGAAIYVLLLTFGEIYDWFVSRRSMSSQDRDRLGFTLQEHLANGNFNTVQGVFNQLSNTVEDARKIESSRVDERLADYHQQQPLVVYP